MLPDLLLNPTNPSVLFIYPVGGLVFFDGEAGGLEDFGGLCEYIFILLLFILIYYN